MPESSLKARIREASKEVERMAQDRPELFPQWIALKAAESNLVQARAMVKQRRAEWRRIAGKSFKEPQP